MKTAIIIGASTGIGRETALALSDKYNSISITSFKHKEELLSLRDDLRQKAASVTVRPETPGIWNLWRSLYKIP